MSIKKSRQILKCSILKNSVWFTLGSEDAAMVCNLRTFSTFFSSTAGQGFENTK